MHPRIGYIYKPPPDTVADLRLWEWTVNECAEGSTAAYAFLWKRLVVLLERHTPPGSELKPIEYATLLVDALYGSATHKQADDE